MQRIVFKYDLSGIELEVLAEFSEMDKMTAMRELYQGGMEYEPELILLEAVCASDDDGVVDTDEIYLAEPYLFDASSPGGRSPKFTSLTKVLEELAWEAR